jgi:hypothetical protein
VSQRTGLKHSTVKKTLYRLEGKGFVKKFCYGYYQRLGDNATLKGSMVGGESGVSVTQNVVEPRLHCLRLRVCGVVGVPCRWVRDFGVVGVVFERFENGSVLVFVDGVGDYCFDYVGFRLLVESVLGELGVSDWGKVAVSSFEFNNDFLGARLDGVQAVTLKSFDGSFRRVYNKRFGLRDEVKAVGSRRVEDVLALLQGGVSQYNLLQLLFANLQKMGEYVEVAKIDRKLFSDAVSSMRRLAEAILKKGEG